MVLIVKVKWFRSFKLKFNLWQKNSTRIHKIKSYYEREREREREREYLGDNKTNMQDNQ